MILELKVDYEQIVGLVKQLSEEEQTKLIKDILNERAKQRPLTVEEKIQLFDSIKIYTQVLEEPSIRREDWYGDDGR